VWYDHGSYNFRKPKPRDNKNSTEKIDKILFIDNEYSIKDVSGRPIEGERNKIVREIFGKNIKIESVIIDLENIHTEIPKIICDQLKNYTKNEIIVDITNGNKYISSILYTSSSLVKIDNIISITKDIDGNYKLNKFKPLDNINSLGKYAYFEIIYYVEIIEHYVQKFYEKGLVDTDYLRQQFRKLMNGILEHYFSGRYGDAISNIGKITEALVCSLCLRYNIPISENKLGMSTYLRSIRKALNTNKLPISVKEEITNIVEIADIIRLYRNSSVHPANKQITKVDSKFILDTFIYLLHLIEHTADQLM